MIDAFPEASAQAAALNISPYDVLPPELSGLEPHKVALITMEESRLLRLRPAAQSGTPCEPCHSQ